VLEADVSEHEALLRAESLVKHYTTREGVPWGRAARLIHAVDGVSFDIGERETLSLVGESGCGKSTTARLLLRLLEPTAGRIVFRGTDVTCATGTALRMYWRSLQAVFQDPWSSLNPRMRAGEIVGEPLLVHGLLSGRALATRVNELLEDVGLDAASARSYPHEFSGGMRQRLAIARALSLRPALIVLDEPMSSLDVSIRAQIMNLLKDLQERHGMSYLLIAHDLGTVRYLSQRVAVMYLGEIVESAPVERLFDAPNHPYTSALIDAARPARVEQSSRALGGDVPSPAAPPSGCRFRTRCPFAFDRCAKEAPRLRLVAPGHLAACHLNDHRSSVPA
jgi:oligopeptide transport system ATP-binding protein